LQENEKDISNYVNLKRVGKMKKRRFSINLIFLEVDYDLLRNLLVSWDGRYFFETDFDSFQKSYLNA
jgi:hypothetical protein